MFYIFPSPALFFSSISRLVIEIWKKKLRWGEETDNNNISNSDVKVELNSVLWSFLNIRQIVLPCFFCVHASPLHLQQSTPPLSKSLKPEQTKQSLSHIQRLQRAPRKRQQQNLEEGQSSYSASCIYNILHYLPQAHQVRLTHFSLCLHFFVFCFYFVIFCELSQIFCSWLSAAKMWGYRGNRTELSHYHAFSSILLLMSQWVFFFFSFPTFSWQPNRVSSVFGLFSSFTVFSKLFFFVVSRIMMFLLNFFLAEIWVYKKKLLC